MSGSVFNSSHWSPAGRLDTQHRVTDSTNPTVVGCQAFSEKWPTGSFAGKWAYAPSNRAPRCLMSTIFDKLHSSMRDMVLFVNGVLLWHGRCVVIRKRLRTEEKSHHDHAHRPCCYRQDNRAFPTREADGKAWQSNGRVTKNRKLDTSETGSIYRHVAASDTTKGEGNTPGNVDTPCCTDERFLAAEVAWHKGTASS